MPFRFNRAEIFLGNFSYQGVARLKPGVTIEQANADIARLIPRHGRSVPDAARVHARDVLTTSSSGRWCGRSKWTSSETSARRCGFFWAPSASCCWSRAPTSRISFSCAPKAGSRSLPFAWRLEPGTKPRGARTAHRIGGLLGLIGGVLGVGLALRRDSIACVSRSRRGFRGCEDITLDPIVLALYARAIARGGIALRRHSGAEVRAAAAGQRPQGQQPRLERRP